MNHPTLKKVNAENPRSKIAHQVKAVHLAFSTFRVFIIEKTNIIKAAGAINRPTTLEKINAENPRSKIAHQIKAVHLAFPTFRILITAKTNTTTPRAPVRICIMPV